MLSKVDLRSTVAVYLQIENHVQFAIASGKLQDDDQLPAVRELSDRLEVNPNTVAKAYRDLEVMGLVYSRQGMGVYIKKGIQAKCRKECYRRTIKRMCEVVSEGKASGMVSKDIVEIVQKSYRTNTDPYSEPPASLTALARKRHAPK